MLSQLIILLIYLLHFINSLSTDQRYARHAHGSVLIDGKLYFVGGSLISSDGNFTDAKDLFYIDVSKSFANNLPSPVPILTNLPVTIAWQAVSAVGHNKSIIFSFGGWLEYIITGQVDIKYF